VPSHTSGVHGKHAQGRFLFPSSLLGQCYDISVPELLPSLTRPGFLQGVVGNISPLRMTLFSHGEKKESETLEVVFVCESKESFGRYGHVEEKCN